jgi:CheY-like chemotaxis protein
MAQSDERERFRFLLKQNQALLDQVRRRAQELEQLFAAQKDAVRKGRKGQSSQTLPEADSDPLQRLVGEGDPGRVVKLAGAAWQDSQRVLIIVEDDADDRHLLSRALVAAGNTARVRWTQSAGGALESMAEEAAHGARICIVADVKLPGIDGFQLLELIKSQGTGAGLKFAFLTGYCDPATKKRAQAQGVDAFFVKPTGAEELLEIAQAIGRLSLSGWRCDEDAQASVSKQQESPVKAQAWTNDRTVRG